MAIRKSGQYARHVAIVLAGAASLSLTAAAGAYIVHEIADTQRGTAETAAPPPVDVPDAVIDDGSIMSPPMLTARSLDLPALFVRLPGGASNSTANLPEAHTVSPAAPAEVGGQLRVGTAYLGAQVAPGQANTVAFTIDTNALTVLTELLLAEPVRDRLGIQNNPAAVTQLRTEVDTRSGELTLTFSDPTLGEHGLRVDRHPVPSKPAPAVVDSTSDGDGPAYGWTSGTPTADGTGPSMTKADHTIAV